MIKFALQCQNLHAFESWFASGSSYDTQVKRGLVECPHCASTKISKQIMAPNIRLGKGVDLSASASEGEDADKPAQTAQIVNSVPMQTLRHMVRELHRHVESTTEDVGKTFSEEARKIHYGEAQDRGIRGRATMEQAEALLEEGIAVMPLPMLPDEHN